MLLNVATKTFSRIRFRYWEEKSAMQGQRLRISRYAIRLHTLYAGGLIAISLIILQDFIGSAKLDLSALVSVVAFAAAIPLLSGMLVADAVQTKYPYSPALSRAPRI